MTGLDKNMLPCPLCGCRFDRYQAQSICGACPLSKNCRIVCCPNCRYPVVSESGISQLWRKYISSRRKIL